jgi:small ligand-binding sensory domain FIST
VDPNIPPEALSSSRSTTSTPLADEQSTTNPTEWVQSTSLSKDCDSAIIELLHDWKRQSSSSSSSIKESLGFLFISPPWANQINQISTKVQALLGDKTKLVTIVGSGIVGRGQENEDPSSYGMSFFGGTIPVDSSIQIIGLTNDDNDKPSIETHSDTITTATTNNEQDKMHPMIDVNSYLVFADPYSKKVQRVLEDCSTNVSDNNEKNFVTDLSSSSSSSSSSTNIVAGAITVAANSRQSTLAIGDTVLPPGSLIRVSFAGNLGLQVVASKGCRPVGPTYRVTKVNGPAIVELDCQRAIDQLQTTIETYCSPEDKEFIQTKGMTKGVLGGMYKEEDNKQPTATTVENDSLNDQKTYGQNDATDMNRSSMPVEPQDFIIRQMAGFQPKSGSILICGRPQVQTGDYFRFHVRSASTALEDWRDILQRAKTERLFLGEEAGQALGALQFSCAARGEALFEEKNVDLHHVQDLVRSGIDNTYDDNNSNKTSKKNSIPPVAGFFCSAEIGPVGNSIRMGSIPDSLNLQQKSFMHGYATVCALICDYSKRKLHDNEAECSTRSSRSTEIEVLGVMQSNSSDVWA